MHVGLKKFVSVTLGQHDQKYLLTDRRLTQRPSFASTASVTEACSHMNRCFASRPPSTQCEANAISNLHASSFAYPTKSCLGIRFLVFIVSECGHLLSEPAL